MSTYKQKFYIAISPGKWQGLNGRMTKTNTGLTPKERLLQIEIEVPASMFQTPQLSAKITVPEKSVTAPELTIETVNNIQEMIKQNMGIEMTINIVEPEKPTN